jgi:plastocyanin
MCPISLVRRWRVPVILLASILTLAACGGGGDDTGSAGDGAAAAGAGEVIIEGFTFVPETIEVPTGTAVTWTNKDSAAHTVVEEGLFESEELDQGETFSFTFDTPGEYSYICGIHPYMTATVTVT